MVVIKESSMSNRKVFVIVAVLVLVLVVGCASTQDDDKITITEKRQINGDAITKSLQANNCDGDIDMKEDLTAVHQYLHDIEVTPNPGVSVNRAAVENEIRNYYQIPQQESDAVCIVPVQIPAGAFYTYDLEWIEIWREGIFELGRQDGQGEGTYRFRQSLLCEVVAQNAESCQ
jgi:hypothetical protein